MIETCTTRRMLILIVALLVSSLVILCFEEYIEDTQLAASRQLRQGGKLSYPVTGDVKEDKHEHADCPQSETLKILEECKQCSAFEVNALQSSYCTETGYYDKFLCGANNKTLFGTCYAKQMKSFARFNLFAGLMIAWSVAFYGFVSWRRKAIELRSYSRLQQFLT
ncbi:Jtr-1 [Aphelenchoides bicaudatus]|nr:Jtr-1 [Aphelenchoides bicaudatus]